MNKRGEQIILEKKLIDLFESNKALVFGDEPKSVTSSRMEAISNFKEKGFPMVNEELWRGTDLSKVLSKDYHQFLNPFLRPNFLEILREMHL